jgi:hypothetical protein
MADEAEQPQRARKRGAETLAARKPADHRLMAMMRSQPEAGVRQLAAMVGVSHPCVSRRIARLKALGMVDHDGGAWAVEAPAAPTVPWMRGIGDFVRHVSHEGAPARFG